MSSLTMPQSQFPLLCLMSGTIRDKKQWRHNHIVQYTLSNPGVSVQTNAQSQPSEHDSFIQTGWVHYQFYDPESWPKFLLSHVNLGNVKACMKVRTPLMKTHGAKITRCLRPRCVLQRLKPYGGGGFWCAFWEQRTYIIVNGCFSIYFYDLRNVYLNYQN